MGAKMNNNTNDRPKWGPWEKGNFNRTVSKLGNTGWAVRYDAENRKYRKAASVLFQGDPMLGFHTITEAKEVARMQHENMDTPQVKRLTGR